MTAAQEERVREEPPILAGAQRDDRICQSGGSVAASALATYRSRGRRLVRERFATRAIVAIATGFDARTRLSAEMPAVW